MALSIKYFYVHKGSNLANLTAYTVPVIYDDTIYETKAKMREQIYSLTEDDIRELRYGYVTTLKIFTTSTMPNGLVLDEDYNYGPESQYIAVYKGAIVGETLPGAPYYKTDINHWFAAFEIFPGPHSLVSTPYGIVPCRVSTGKTIPIRISVPRNPPDYSDAPAIFYAARYGTGPIWTISMHHLGLRYIRYEIVDYLHGFTDVDENPYVPQLTGPYAPGGESGPAGGGGIYGDGFSDNIANSIPNGTVEANSSAVGLFTRYAMNAVQIKALAEKIYADNFLEKLGLEVTKFLWNSPIDAIISCQSYPFSVTSLVGSSAVNDIKLGAVPTGLSGSALAGTAAKIDWGSISLEEYWKNFLDYAPHTKIELYLPWSTGFVEIDPHECLPGSIGVVTNIEFGKGTCQHIVTGNKGSVIGVFSGVCGTTLPLTSIDTASKAINVVTAAAGLAVAAVTGGAATSAGIAAGIARGSGATLTAKEFATNVAGTKAAISAAERPYKAMQGASLKVAAQSSVAAFRQPPHVVRNGSFNGNGAGMGIQYPFIILSRPTQSVPKNYGHYYGYPSNIYTTLGSVSGYTEVASVHLDGISCTGQEREEIDNLLKGGVIL